jgi:ABC-type glycerol-3-phosphate transport system substrate-binding protein
VRRLVLLVTLVVLVAALAGSSASAASDSNGSPTHSNIYNNEITTNQTEGSNSLASAPITITMHTGDDE